MAGSTSRRRHAGRAAIIAVSALAHGLALILLGLSSPALRDVRRADLFATPVEIWTPPRSLRTPAAVHGAAKVSPARAGTVRTKAVTGPVSPLTSSPTPPAGAPPAPLPAPSHGDLRAALRRSTVGCANRDTVGLTLREREACLDAYARGKADADVIAPPIESGKLAAFDAAAARKERIRKRKAAPPQSSLDPGNNAGGTKTNGIGILGY